MKNLFLATVVAAMAFAVNANAQISVGAGYANETVISKTSYKMPDEIKGYSWDKNMMQLNGFYIEAAYNLDLAKVASGTLSVQPGVRYYCLTDINGKSKSNWKGTNEGQKVYQKTSGKSSYSDHFIDIPINVKYSYDIVSGALKAYAFAGPVLSLGLAANSVDIKRTKADNGSEKYNFKEMTKYNTYTGKYVIETYDYAENKPDIEKGKDDKYKSYNMFDLKLALGLGITISEKVDIKFGYNIGLLNRSFVKNVDDTKYATHSNVLYFGAAYNF